MQVGSKAEVNVEYKEYMSLLVVHGNGPSLLGRNWLRHIQLEWREVNRKSTKKNYIAQYPVRWTAESASHFLPSLTDLFISTPTRVLREAF